MHIRAPLLKLLDGRGDRVRSPLHLPYISPLYLPYISPISPRWASIRSTSCPRISPLYLPYISLYLPYISQVGLDPEHELPEERYAARVTLKVNT